MSVEENKAVVTRFYQLIEENRYDELKDLMHPDFRFYSQIDHPLTGEEFIRQEKNHMDACPGFTMRIHKMFAEGDLVACYLVYEGVHTKPFMGLPPTNNKVRFSLMFMITLKDGKFYEKRAHYDGADILRQHGMDILCPSLA